MNCKVKESYGVNSLCKPILSSKIVYAISPHHDNPAVTLEGLRPPILKLTCILIQATVP